MAVHRLSGADIVMANELFMASPDGLLEAARIEQLVADLPGVAGEFSGHWCGPDCACSD